MGIAPEGRHCPIRGEGVSRNLTEFVSRARARRAHRAHQDPQPELRRVKDAELHVARRRVEDNLSPARVVRADEHHIALPYWRGARVARQAHGARVRDADGQEHAELEGHGERAENDDGGPGRLLAVAGVEDIRMELDFTRGVFGWRGREGRSISYNERYKKYDAPVDRRCSSSQCVGTYARHEKYLQCGSGGSNRMAATAPSGRVS